MLNKNNIQICVTLPKKEVKKLDKLAKKDKKTRSKFAGKIILEYLESITEDNK